MTERKLYKVLMHVAYKSYPESYIKPFFVKLENVQRDSTDGRYVWQDGKIILYNLSRDISDIYISALHLTAHHIAYTTKRDSQHDRYFYSIFLNLVNSSIAIGYLDKEKIYSNKDINLILKKAGPITAVYQSEVDVNKDNRTVVVKNCYTIADKLKEKNYFYSTLERLWEKDMTLAEAEQEMKEFKALCPKAEIVVKPITELGMEVNYLFIVSGNTYPSRKELLDRGYYFNRGKKSWSKIVSAQEKEQEILFINGLSNSIELNIY